MPNKNWSGYYTKEGPTDKTSGAKGSGKAKAPKGTFGNSIKFGTEFSSSEGEVCKESGLKPPKRGGGFLEGAK